MYGINGKSLKVIQSLYERNEACVRVCREEDEWFRVGVGLRQGCVISPWSFNVFMDGVMKEVREAVGDVGATLWDARSNSEWKVRRVCVKHYKRQSCAVLSFREQSIFVSSRGHRETRLYSIKDSHFCVCV